MSENTNMQEQASRGRPKTRIGTVLSALSIVVIIVFVAVGAFG